MTTPYGWTVVELSWHDNAVMRSCHGMTTPSGRTIEELSWHDNSTIIRITELSWHDNPTMANHGTPARRTLNFYARALLQ
jgi:phage tail protein X